MREYVCDVLLRLLATEMWLGKTNTHIASTPTPPSYRTGEILFVFSSPRIECQREEKFSFRDSP